MLAVVWFYGLHYPLYPMPETHAATPGSPFEKRCYGALRQLDAAIGSVRDTVFSGELADNNTLLLYCSDNGPVAPASESTLGLRGYKRSLCEGGIRVPGVLEWPARIAFNRRVRYAASTMDLLPTLLEILELDGSANAPFDGASLMPVITGEAPVVRPGPIAWKLQEQLAYTLGKYKIVGNNLHCSEQKSWGAFQLFDLDADPAEQKNLKSKKSTRDRMVAELCAWVADVAQNTYC